MEFEKTFKGDDLMAIIDIVKLLEKLPKEHQYTVSIKTLEKGKTRIQHNWFFVHRVRPLATHIGYTPNEMYDAMKQHFGVDTTADMTTKEFSDFVITVDVWAAQEHGFIFSTKF
jgi:hypothetical protein